MTAPTKAAFIRPYREHRMHKGLAATLLAFSGLASATATPDAWIGARPSVAMTVAPVAGSDQFEVRAVITDLRNGAVLARPQLRARAGAPAQIEVGVSGSPQAVRLNLSVTVAADGHRAVYQSEVFSNDTVIAAQRSELTLSP